MSYSNSKINPHVEGLYSLKSRLGEALSRLNQVNEIIARFEFNEMFLIAHPELIGMSPPNTNNLPDAYFDSRYIGPLTFDSTELHESISQASSDRYSILKEVETLTSMISQEKKEKAKNDPQALEEEIF